MQDKLRTWYGELNDRLPTVRRLEATAHLASWLAVSLTALMVGTAMATESNPVARWLIETLGMRGFGVLSAVLVSALYRLLSWASVRSDGGEWQALSGAVTTGLVLDAAGNIWGVIQVGLPERTMWATVLPTVLIIAGTALVCYLRVLSGIWARCRLASQSVPSRLARQAGVIGMAVVLVSAAPTLVVGPAMASDHWTGGAVVEDFEDGSANVKYGDGSVVEGGWIEGDYYFNSDSVTFSISDNTYETLSFWYRAQDMGGTETIFYMEDGGDNHGPHVKASGGKLQYYDGSSYLNTGINYTRGSTIRLVFSNIDYGNNTYTLKSYNRTGELIGSYENAPFDSGISSISQIDYSRSGCTSCTGDIDGIRSGVGYPADLSSGDEAKEVTVTVDDQTENNQFANPTSTTWESNADTQYERFNGDDQVQVPLQPDQLYSYSLRSESGAVWELSYNVRAEYLPDEVTIRPGASASGDITQEGFGVRLNRATNNLSADLSQNDTRVAVSTEEPVTRINYTIEDDNGNPVYNDTREFDEPTSYYETQVSANQTNGTAADEGYSLDYSGTYENGTTFSGTTDYSGEISGGLFGPTGDSDGDSGSPVVGVALVGGAGYLAYRRFGSGQLKNAVSSAAGRLRP